MPSAINRALHRFWRSRAANMAVFGALAAPLVLTLAAVGIDEGGLYSERRALQALADLAAITAAAHPAKAQEMVLLTLLDNGVQAAPDTDPFASTAFVAAAGRQAKVSVTAGHYRNDPALAAEARFVAGAEPTNAFRVKLARRGNRYFGSDWLPTPVLRTAAIGHAAPEAAFTIGSRLASLDGGVANALLGALLGTEVSLSVMDYRGLLGARVTLLDMLDCLAANLHLNAATYADVLDARVTLPALTGAMASTPGVDSAAAAALRKLGRSGGSGGAIDLQALFDLGSLATRPLGVRQGGIAASAGAMEIVNAAAALARNGRQAEVHLVATAPGILDATLTLSVGERAQSSPWLAIGERGEKVRTAQTRLLLRLRLKGPGGLLGGSITLPIYAELAFAEAQLADIRCAAGQTKPSRVSVDARPGIAELRIADPGALEDFSRAPVFAPATLVDAGLVRIRGSSQVSVAETLAKDLSFTAREIEDGAAKTVSTRDLLASPTRALVDNLRLDVEAAGLGISAGLGTTLGQVLGNAAAPVDALLQSVLTAAGISLGEADVWVNGGACNRAVLVQ